jgi:hypothetical protein
MPDPDDESAELTERVRSVSPGLIPLLAEAQATWSARGADGDTPGWRAFEDAFPTFYQFTNRPR